MNKFFYLTTILLTASFLTLTSCGEDDPVPSCTDGIQNQDETGIDCGGVCASCNESDVHLTGSIATQTLTNDRIYILDQKVVVEDGVTLTIEAGTIIKGSTGAGSLASALIIVRGGKIIAEGTAAAPIIFTSINDNIAVGETTGSNLSVADKGLWGGVVILGKAKGSFVGDVTEFQIEGIPAGDTYGLYGGNDDADNSGVFNYVSIRHGGSEIGEGNELNGLTLGCVGNNTEISNIEIVGNDDDGVEFFGGTVNVSNVLIWGQDDDGLDIDQAYSGTISNAMVIEGSTSDSALEIDGPEGSYDASFTLNNITLIGAADGGKYADFRKGALGSVNNVYAYNFDASSIIRLKDDPSAQSYTDATLTFSNWEITLPSGVATSSELFIDNSDSNLAPTFTADAALFSSAVTTTTVGADSSVFSWTYANAQGAY